MLRAHRRTNADFYVGRRANVYVNKLTSVDLTRHAVRCALNQLNQYSGPDDNQASEIAAFLGQYVEYLTEAELKAKQEETFDDLVSKANVVSPEDDLFKLHTHDRHPLLKMDSVKAFLKETLFEGKTCDM